MLKSDHLRLGGIPMAVGPLVIPAPAQFWRGNNINLLSWYQLFWHLKYLQEEMGTHGADPKLELSSSTVQLVAEPLYIV